MADKSHIRKSQDCEDTRLVRVKPPVDNEPTIADLAMLVARLVQQLRHYDPNNGVASKAMDYLRRRNLTASILREVAPIIDDERGVYPGTKFGGTTT